MDRLIDRFLPAPDVRTVHTIRVRASPEQVLQVAEQFDLESLAEAEPNPRRTRATVFRTETRARGTDEDARRRFRRYCRLFSPGIVLLRLVLLPAVRRVCEHPPGPSGTP